MKNLKLKSAVGAGLLAGGMLLSGPVSTAFAKSAPTSTRHSFVGTGVSIAPGGNTTAVANCPVGWHVTGGGGSTSGIRIYFTDSYQSGNGWAIRGTNVNNVAETLFANVVCSG